MVQQPKSPFNKIWECFFPKCIRQYREDPDNNGLADCHEPPKEQHKGCVPFRLELLVGNTLIQEEKKGCLTSGSHSPLEFVQSGHGSLERSSRSSPLGILFGGGSASFRFELFLPPAGCSIPIRTGVFSFSLVMIFCQKKLVIIRIPLLFFPCSGPVWTL
jgi:hypothetical protein